MTDEPALEPLNYQLNLKPFEIAAMSQAASFKRIADALETMASKGQSPLGLSGMITRRGTSGAAAPYTPAIDGEGFNAWPGRVKPPCEPGDEVVVKRRDGNIQQAFAGTLRWMWGSQVQHTDANGQLVPQPDQPGDIVGWKMVPPDPALNEGR